MEEKEYFDSFLKFVFVDGAVDRQDAEHGWLPQVLMSREIAV